MEGGIDLKKEDRRGGGVFKEREKQHLFNICIKCICDFSVSYMIEN